MSKKQHSLNYRIVGNGYPVVFIHGFLESNQMWKNLLPQFSGIQAICIELPGHGDSPLLDKKLTFSTITQAIKSTIQTLEIDEFTLVGHSMGGYVALHLAEEKELNINQLVLFHSHPWADSPSKKKDRERAAKIVDYNKILFLKESIPNLYYQPEKFETQVNTLVEEAYEMSEEAITQSLLAMRDREDKVSVLKEWKEKIHIIQGEFDPLIDTEKLGKLAKELENQFYLIKSIGHIGYQENETEVVRLLTNIFNK